MKTLAELKITPELLNKMEDCDTPEEIVAVAKAYDIAVTLEEAKEILAIFERDLTEEEMEKISGCDDCGVSNSVARDLKSLLGQLFRG